MSKIVEALMGRSRRFASYRPLVDRTDDEGEDTEVAIAVQDEDHHRGNLQYTIRELVRQLEQTPYDVCGSAVFAPWQRLARIVAKKTMENIAFSMILANEMSLSFGLYHDDGNEVVDSPPLFPTRLRESEPGIFLVEQFAMLEVLSLGLAVQPNQVVDALADFLHYFGSACELELQCDKALAVANNALPTDLVLAHRTSAFYTYARSLPPKGFFSQPNTATKALQTFPLPNAVAHVLTAPKHRAVDEATYEVFPLWPYFAWKALTKTTK